MWGKILVNVMEMSSPGRKNGSIWVPKVNGKHSKHVQHVSLKVEGDVLSQGNGVAKMMQANIPLYKEVLPSLESWQASKITAWHNLEGHSIQWFCVVCIDRRGKLFPWLKKTVFAFFLLHKEASNRNGHIMLVGMHESSDSPVLLGRIYRSNGYFHGIR